jgi:hypothetical protein
MLQYEDGPVNRVSLKIENCWGMERFSLSAGRLFSTSAFSDMLKATGGGVLIGSKV